MMYHLQTYQKLMSKYECHVLVFLPLVVKIEVPCSKCFFYISRNYKYMLFSVFIYDKHVTDTSFQCITSVAWGTNDNNEV